MAKDDGGPACPVTEIAFRGGEPDGILRQHLGMTLRDSFLKSIMQGLTANPNVIGYNANHGWGLVNCNESQLVGFAMDLVDAMLEARAK